MNEWIVRYGIYVPENLPKIVVDMLDIKERTYVYNICLNKYIELNIISKLTYN